MLSYFFLVNNTASLFGWTYVPPIIYTHFLISEYQTTPNCETVTVSLKTDVPCHMWLRFTKEKIRKHPRTVVVRGLATSGDLRTCFVAYTDIEQEEDWDTLEHTFIITELTWCHTYYFYFWATSFGEVMTYTSAIFNFFYPFGTPPFKTCEKQEESDTIRGFLQEWNAPSQTFTPTHTYKVHHLSLMLKQWETTRRGPYCVKITIPDGDCWAENVIAYQKGYSALLPLPGEKEWVDFYDITPLLQKDTLYRIVVHTLPGWQVWDVNHWKPWKAGAAMTWWAKIDTNPYPRGFMSTGCNFEGRSGIWIPISNDDFTFILWRTCK
ncbi:hypothetical protein ES708_25839 [subsurface metagenome]